MGKIVKTIVGIATFAAAFIPGIGTAVAGVLKTIGASLTLSGVSEIIAGTPKSPGIEDSGQRLTLTTNPTAPREICYGKAATGGNLIFRDTVGSNNSDLWMVTVLAGHEIESLEEVKFGGKVVTFSANQAVGEFAGKWFQFVHLGTDTQTADVDLVAASTKWTTNHRLRGVAYVVNRFIFDQDIFPKGLEQIVYTIKGKKVYDPRLDTTQGGSGSHRFTDKSTWAFSENSALCNIDYLRGETQNSKLIWGMAQIEAAFDWPSNIAEANICEEQITLKAGGTEDRYTCNGFLNSSDRHETNIRAILSSCAGNLVWQSGKWRIYVGAARTAIKTRVENQFIGPVKYIPKKEYQKRSNAIRGLYNDPEAGFQTKDYPPVINSTFVTEDGGQELWGDLNLPMTKSKATAQRLANIALRQARMEKIFSGTLNTIGFEDQAQDSVNLTYSRFNLSNQKMIISDWALRFQQDENNNVGLVVEETFIETDDNIYAWTAATDEATIPTVVDLLNPPPVLLAWDDVNTRPVELTDGRISAGLDVAGNLNRNITTTRANSSNVLRRTTGGLFAGDLDANLTSANTSNDTSNVSGVAALTVKDGAAKADLGLNTSGDLNRNITSARANSSNVLRRTTGGLYAGALDATLGAKMGTDLFNSSGGVENDDAVLNENTSYVNYMGVDVHVGKDFADNLFQSQSQFAQIADMGLVPGDTIHMSLEVFSDIGVALTARVRFFDATLTFFGGVTADPFTNATSPTRIAASGIIPAGTTQLDIGVTNGSFASNSGAGQVHWAKGIVTKGSANVPYAPPTALLATRQVNQGAFNVATIYQLGDVVTDAGSSFEYINTTPSSGNLTTNGIFWALLAATGTDGTNGTDGNFKDLKFITSDALPATPTGDNPVGWTDTIPATGTRWQSVATKTFGGNLIGSWSTPTLFGGVYRGTWSSVATYNLGDSVSHTGRTFILTVTSSVNNIPPTSNTSDAFWDLLSAKGDSGDPPVAFIDTATHSNGTVLNMRTLANGLGYDGVSDATFTVTVSANITANPGTVDAITTGTWPTGPTIALTLIVNTGVVIRGGGGNGGNGGDLVSGAAGGRGGDGINLAKDLTITLNGTSTVSGGSGGGGGGAGFFQLSPEQEGTGGGGGGGFPNGIGGLGPSSAGNGGNGTVTSGGTGGVGFNGGGDGGNGGGVSGITPSDSGLAGGSASAAGGARGLKGDGIKQNGNVATIGGTGTNSGLGA